MGEQMTATVPADMTVGDLAEVLFCSTLQPSEPVDPAKVQAVLSSTLHSHHGEVRECAEELATSYGKDPEVTCLRMRWARSVVAATFPMARAAI